MLNKALVKELAEHRGNPFMTSLFLDVDGRKFPRPSDLEPKVENLFRIAREKAARREPGFVQVVEGDIDRFREWISQRLERDHVRGMAAFSCHSQGFFSTVSLSIPFHDEISIDKRPHVAQLLDALEATKPWLAVLVDQEESRLLQIEGRTAHESAGPFDELPRQVDTDVELGSFERHHEEAVRRHLRHVADAVATEARRIHAERIVLAGPAAGELEHYLHSEDARRLAGVITLAMSANADEVIAAAEALLTDGEDRRQIGLVDNLVARVGAGSTLGLSDTLDALAARRVGTLIVNRGLATGGVRCLSCGYLALEGARCPRCGEATEDVGDVVEAALVDALAQGANVEIVDVPELALHGSAGSIERY